MDIKEINRRIKAIGTKSAKMVAEVQNVGLACLTQVEEHNNTTPINALVAALPKSQVAAFVAWALAFGKVSKTSAAKMAEGQFLAYDKSKETDMAGATATMWDDMAGEKADTVKAAFDLQKSMMGLLKKAAQAGQPQSIIDAMAKAVGITSSIPKSVPADKVGEALV